ncbi:DsbA family protein [Streptomyces sp. NPDC092952]|uniref:DsbA family oxidoreductase n=1 Tax=Streptomyces sp. NPDC092952 TaxID=3366018 RepID=UPI00382B9673
MRHIEVWADVVCAWAYIGKRRLAAALEEWDGEPVEVVWRPFRIDPMAPARAEPLQEVLRDPVVDAALQGCAPGMTAAENRARVSEIAAAEGLGPRWGAAWRASSHDAHRLVALAYEQGGAALQDAVLEGVLRAHFVERRDISLVSTLQEIASATGFAEGARLLGGGGAEEYVREALLRGKAIGVTTSPTLVIGAEALAGAHAPEVIARFVARAVAEPWRDEGLVDLDGVDVVLGEAGVRECFAGGGIGALSIMIGSSPRTVIRWMRARGAGRARVPPPRRR